jgi:hypothetical protein
MKLENLRNLNNAHSSRETLYLRTYLRHLVIKGINACATNNMILRTHLSAFLDAFA